MEEIWENYINRKFFCVKNGILKKQENLQQT